MGFIAAACVVLMFIAWSQGVVTFEFAVGVSLSFIAASIGGGGSHHD